MRALRGAKLHGAAERGHNGHMRVKARVVGNTLVVEAGVSLPEGAEVEVDVLLRSEDSVEVDEATAKELELAHREADAGDFAGEHEVAADLA